MSRHADTFFRREPIYRAMADMPALTHWRDRGRPWTPEQSDVLPWIVALGVTLADAQRILPAARVKGVVEFLPARNLWRGTEDTRRLEDVADLLTRRKRAKRTPKQRAAKPAQRSTAPAPGPRVRCNDRMAAALVVFERWRKASKVPAWTFADLVRSFVIHSGDGKADTMRRYIRALHAAGWLVKDADGMLSASSPTTPAP
jgi:hypothetical protein